MVVGVLALVATRGSDEEEKPQRGSEVERTVVGRGPLAAVVLRRRDAPPQRAVVFLHGWRLLGGKAYEAWMLDLARSGVTVIAPRYQERRGTPPETALDNALAGVRAALRQTAVASGGVVLVGHSAGAILAVDYAAVAARQGLPPARGVLAIYPGSVIRATSEPIPRLDLSQIPSTVQLTVMASETDEIVGDQPARDIWSSATSIPPAQRRFVWVRDPIAGDHFAPALDTDAARDSFWRQLTRLLRSSG